MPQKQRGIVLYDFLQVRGGAEAVTLAAAEALAADALCVGFREAVFPASAISGLDLITLGGPVRSRALQYLSGIRRFERRTRFLADYDWVLYSGSSAPCAVHRHAGRNILYCHTPPRFVYDLKDYWLGRAAWWQYLPLRLLIGHVKRHYEAAFRKMDLVIANSENVRRRIRDYFDRDSLVIHPPCDTGRFVWLGHQDYYLSTSRLEPYKRVDLVVKAFLRMPEKKLVVASGGSELGPLKALAEGAPNIRFTGWTSDGELAELVGNALATVYIPVDEDFGMSPVESMAAGKPVIGVAEGGLLETVVPERTGILLPAEPGVEDLVEAVNRMTPALALSMREACEERAKLFGKEVFARKMRQALGLEAGQDI